jgi:glyoxylase-like metal-dependent hydrolase (beta-lactamase superfamily II)
MVIWPRNYRYPDLTYEDSLELEIGDEKLVLYHAMGETDDATWVWLPKRKTIVAGDLFLWVCT